MAAALASAKTDLDAAVAADQITQDKADAIYSRLETWLNDGGPGNLGTTPSSAAVRAVALGRTVQRQLDGGHHHLHLSLLPPPVRKGRPAHGRPFGYPVAAASTALMRDRSVRCWCR